MKEYQGFAISNFRTGFDESVEPWLLPRDAYQRMVNAHLYRGVVEKIEGYSLFAPMTYRRQIAMTEVPDGMIKTFTVTLPAGTTPVTSNFFGYGTLVLGVSAETFSYFGDASSTLINLSGSAGGTGTVNLTTRVVTLNFNTAPPAGTYSCVFFRWDYAPATDTAIMGIKQYFAANSSQQVLVFDQKRVGYITGNVGILAETSEAINNVEEIPHDYNQSAIFTPDGILVTFTGTLGTTPIVPGTVRIFQFAGTTPFALELTISDNSFGLLTGTGVAAGSYINYSTGAYTITFTVAPAAGKVFNSIAGVFGDLFTGTYSNFFTLCNYQAKAFFTNNVDPIMFYDGLTIKYLITNLTAKLTTSSAGAPSNTDITKTLHVFVNRERLLLIAPTLRATGPALSTVYWSEAFVPTNFVNGGVLPAPTSEPIRTFGFINSDLVLRFSNSERVFRYTGDGFSPFRFDSTNNMWACDTFYSSINYDSWFSTVGKPAIVGSDAVNVKRVDEMIPDFTDPTRLAQQVPVPYMSQTSIQQCYGERFDDIKEGWLCYNSGPQGQSSVTASDNVLAFNYLDNTYAVYSFPLSCLGFGKVVTAPTWGTTYTPWEEMSDTWDSFSLQKNGLLDLAGDQFGRVMELNSSSTCTNVAGEEIPVLFDVITKNFNPFIEGGQFARLGYIDLFVSAYNSTKLRVQFYVNDQLYIGPDDQPAGYYQENTLTFESKGPMSPNTNQTKVWKRIYVGAVGKEHTIRFYQNEDDFPPNDSTASDDQPVYIHAMILWMKPAGVIFQ